MDIEKIKKPERIRFKPLTEGLGLNHFADGLQPAHHVHSPANTPAHVPVIGSFNIVEQAPATEDYHPAHFIKRVLAYLVDTLIAWCVFVFTAWTSFALSGFELKALVDTHSPIEIITPLLLFYFVLHLGYFLIQETTWHSTLGKSLFKIRIQNQSSFATLARVFCFLLSLIPFGVGLFWYFFDKKKRCWHDVVTNSETVCP